MANPKPVSENNEVAIMSIQKPVTVLLANRPRLFRELLQHALKTQPSTFRVVEAVDAPLSSSLLRSADWLIVDEESATEATKWVSSNPQLGIIVLDGRGNSARVIASRSEGAALQSVPTLADLFSLLVRPTLEPA